MNSEEKTTALFEELKNVSMKHGFRDYLKNHPEVEQACSFSDFMNDYVAGNPKISTTDIIRNCGFDRDYARQLINGKKPQASRDRIIALCLSAHMDLTTTQRALKISNNAILYPKTSVKDMALTICINNQCWNITTVNEYLDDNGCELLKLSKDCG